MPVHAEYRSVIAKVSNVIGDLQETLTMEWNLWLGISGADGAMQKLPILGQGKHSVRLYAARRSRGSGSSILGHYDAGFTLRTYTHATRQKQEQAAEKMGDFMSQVM